MEFTHAFSAISHVLESKNVALIRQFCKVISYFLSACCKKIHHMQFALVICSNSTDLKKLNKSNAHTVITKAVFDIH